jgi:hypothetical protein
LLTRTEAVPKAKIPIQCKPSNLLNNVKMVGLSYLICNLSFSICIKFLHWTEESPAPPTKGDKRRRPKTQNCETCTISVDFSWEIDKRRRPKTQNFETCTISVDFSWEIDKTLCNKLIVAVNSNFLHIKSTYIAL